MRERAVRCLSLTAHGARLERRPETWHDSGLCDACLVERDRLRREAAADALEPDVLLRKKVNR